MRLSKGIGILSVGSLVMVLASGCVSLDDHRRLESAHRKMTAQKEDLVVQLDDARRRIDAAVMRANACAEELETKEQLLASLQSEKQLLDESRLAALRELERLANQPIGDIIINAPKLPKPLDNALKQFADAHPSSVEYDAARGTVRWKSDLLFALGSDVVRKESAATLKQFTEILKSPEAAGFDVIIVGHTDNAPIKRRSTRAKHPTNWHLSAHRAIAVSEVLQHDSYPARRIGIMGFGPYRPVADNATPEGKSLNRRVEIYLVPSGTIANAAAEVAAAPTGDPHVKP
ncbi:MAG: OmpA family protein [Phycisphaerae bacterium]